MTYVSGPSRANKQWDHNLHAGLHADLTQHVLEAGVLDLDVDEPVLDRNRYGLLGWVFSGKSADWQGDNEQSGQQDEPIPYLHGYPF